MVQPVSFVQAPTAAAPRPLAVATAQFVAQTGASDAGEAASPAPPTAPVQTPAAVVQIAAAAIPNAPHPYGPDAARKPLSMSVDRSDSGVFVYTLRDPDSGSVVAVIPRELLKNPAGAKVDTSA